jgi:hypothetical protein
MTAQVPIPIPGCHLTHDLMPNISETCYTTRSYTGGDRCQKLAKKEANENSSNA